MLLHFDKPIDWHMIGGAATIQANRTIQIGMTQGFGLLNTQYYQDDDNIF